MSRCYLLLIALALVSCARLQTPQAVEAGPERIRARATNFFDRTILIKPQSESPAAALEPLLMLETDAGTNAILPGMVAPAEKGWIVSTTPPAVYTNAGTIVLKGQPHVRHAFVWFYPSKNHGTLKAQGVAITLDRAGLPMIWEVLQDSSGFSILYVGRSLETEAAAKYGPPQSGRSFAVERSLTEAGRSVVARVLDDGPVPMGPIVQVTAREQNVAAVICRCMPVQVRELVSTQTYLTLPIDSVLRAPGFPEAVGRGIVSFLNASEAGARLERALRLP